MYVCIHVSLWPGCAAKQVQSGLGSMRMSRLLSRVGEVFLWNSLRNGSCFSDGFWLSGLTLLNLVTLCPIPVWRNIFLYSPGQYKFAKIFLCYKEISVEKHCFNFNTLHCLCCSFLIWTLKQFASMCPRPQRTPIVLSGFWAKLWVSACWACLGRLFLCNRLKAQRVLHIL